MSRGADQLPFLLYKHDSAGSGTHQVRGNINLTRTVALGSQGEQGK